MDLSPTIQLAIFGTLFFLLIVGIVVYRLRRLNKRKDVESSDGDAPGAPKRTNATPPQIVVTAGTPQAQAGPSSRA